MAAAHPESSGSGRRGKPAMWPPSKRSILRRNNQNLKPLSIGATGILDCLDAATGGLIWTREALRENGLPNTYFGKSSSPLVVDDLLLVQTEQGPIALVEANPSTHCEVARLNGLSAKTWNTPALAGEFLLVRNDQEAVCYQLPKRSSQASERSSREGN